MNQDPKQKANEIFNLMKGFLCCKGLIVIFISINKN